jgi:short-subunit dehydrogenase
MGKFDGKIALVTGASSGIGAELARQLAREGADLVLTARRTDRLEQLAEEIRALGRRALACACDVTVDGDLERAVEQAHQKLGGPLDVVVANAGFGVSGPVARLTLADFRRQFETNVFGVLRTLYAGLEDLEQTRGRLAIVSSVSGYASFPGTAPYAMSKFAVRALCDALAGELRGSGVSVTMLTPGFVTSEIRQVNNRGQHRPDARDFVPPWLRMPTDRAARQMVSAIHRRKRERIITIHGRLIIWVRQFLPGLYWLAVRMSGNKRRRTPKK